METSILGTHYVQFMTPGLCICVTVVSFLFYGTPNSPKGTGNVSLTLLPAFESLFLLLGCVVLL